MALANRTLEGSPEKSDAGRIQHLFRLVLQRKAEPAELQPLEELLASQRKYYTAQPAEAGKVLSVGVVPKAGGISEPEQAAWVACSRVLLNLHETITRE